VSRSWKPYILLMKSKMPPSNVAPFSFCISMALSLIFTSVLVGRDLISLLGNLTLSLLSMAATALSAYIYNDIIDVEIDRVNRRNRPLVTGEASQNHARNIVIFLGMIGLTSALIINSKVFLLMLTFFTLCFLYSFPRSNLKRKFLIRDLTIATGTAITYLIGSVAVGIISAPILLMAVVGFVVALSASILKDFGDIIGDEIHKIKTLPIVWGPTQTIRFAMALVFTVGIATVVGYFQLGFNTAFPILASCAFAAWIFVIYPLYHHRNEPSYLVNARMIVIKRIAPICFSIQMLTMFGAIL